MSFHNKSITKQIFNFLNENVPYAILRNYEGLPYKNKSRDIDIAIKKKDYLAIKNQLIYIIERNGWKIITYLHSDRLVTWVCGIIDEDKTELIQFDFFFHTSVFGIKLLSSEEIISSRVFNGYVYHTNPEFEFLDKYLYDRAVGARYPSKYKSIMEVAQKSEFVKKKIKEIFGVDSITQCDKASSQKLLFHTLKRNFTRHPLSSTWDVLCILFTFVRNYICSNTGFSIGFTGPDGSGKTTIIDMMIEELGNVFRTAHAYYHFRPNLFRNISDVAHSAGLKKEVDKNYDQPHRGNKTGKASSLIRLGYYSIDYILGYFLKVKTITRITRIVIFDRYYTDIICDSRRSRIYLNTKFLYRFGRLFIPALDYNILLTASTETILSRKAELDKEDIKNINNTIDFLSANKQYLKILNDSTPHNTVIKILSHVFDNQHKKNLKRLT